MYEPGKEFVLDPHSSFLPTLSNDLGIVSQRIHWFNAQVFPGIVTKYTQKIIILKKKNVAWSLMMLYSQFGFGQQSLHIRYIYLCPIHPLCILISYVPWNHLLNSFTSLSPKLSLKSQLFWSFSSTPFKKPNIFTDLSVLYNISHLSLFPQRLPNPHSSNPFTWPGYL